MATAPPDDDDVDLTLRHVTHRFPEDLARALLPDAGAIARCAWLDTQLTARERRLDKSLLVEADGVARAEHVEWQIRWTRDLPLRVYEYNALTTLALHQSAAPGALVPRVRSTVVLLGGRARPWPAEGRFRTSPPGERFSGLRFRIEPVYQRTLAELAARESPLWMIFAPLAVDATPDAMAAVVTALRERSSREHFDELAVAMAVLADADGRRRGLRTRLAALLPPELVMRNWIYQHGLERGIEQGLERGIEQGLERGIEQGLERGEARGLREAIALAAATRGLPLSDAQRATLDAEARVAVLQRWLTRAVTAAPGDEIFAPD